MSGAASGLAGSSGFTQGGNLFGPVFLTPNTPFRAIGPEAPGGPSGGLYFVADVTESEEHRDELYITEHPIEAGANISDHAYKRPAQVQLRLGWSNSAFFNFDPYYINSTYLSLLQFQADRAPFTLYTGKRVYQNMLMQSLVVETDETSEWALRVEMSLQQVFIVNTQTTTINSNPNNQSNPQSTLPTTSAGTQTTAPATNLNTSSYNTVFSSPSTPNASPNNAQVVPIQAGASNVPTATGS